MREFYGGHAACASPGQSLLPALRCQYFDLSGFCGEERLVGSS